MSHRGSKLYVPHPLSSYLALDYLNTALLTDNPPVLHPTILSTETLVIPYRTKDLGTEKTIPFRLKGTIVYGLRLFNLSIAPLPYLLWRGKGYLYSPYSH